MYTYFVEESCVLVHNIGCKSSGEAGKLINSRDQINFKQSSIDKTFAKHSCDFGTYANDRMAVSQV